MGFYSHLLNQKAVIKKVKGSDSNNNPKIVDTKEIACRVEFKASMTIGSSGQQTASTGRLYTEEELNVGDLMEFNDRQFTIINVSPYYTFDASNVVVEAQFQ